MSTSLWTRRVSLGLLALAGMLLAESVALPRPAMARDSTALGVGTGAVAGALVAGPVGAVVGGIVGGVVGSQSESVRPRRGRRVRAARARSRPSMAQAAQRPAPSPRPRPVADAAQRPATTWTNPR